MKYPKWLSRIFADNDAVFPLALAIWQFDLAMWHFNQSSGLAAKNPTFKIIYFIIFLCVSMMLFGLGVWTVAKRFRPRQVVVFRKS